MRIRRLLLAGILAGSFAVVLVPAAAHAASPAVVARASEGELRECVEKALKDNPTNEDDLRTDLDKCHAAPSLLTPAVSEIFWGALAFAIVAIALIKFAFPALRKSLKAREDKIRDDLESASQARTQAEGELAQYRAQIADARAEANAIVEEARATSDQVRRDAVSRAEAEAADVRTRAQEDIRLAQERAMSDLRTRVADLSIELAEKVVERNLDRDTQIALIESYISSVGNGQR